GHPAQLRTLRQLLSRQARHPRRLPAVNHHAPGLLAPDSDAPFGLPLPLREDVQFTGDAAKTATFPVDNIPSREGKTPAACLFFSVLRLLSSRGCLLSPV